MCARQNWLNLARGLLIPSTLDLGVHLLMNKLLSETLEVHSGEESTSAPRGIQIHPWTGPFRQHLRCSKPNTPILTLLQTGKINKAAAWWHPCYWRPEKKRQIHLNLKPEWCQLYKHVAQQAPTFLSLWGNKIHSPVFVLTVYCRDRVNRMPTSRACLIQQERKTNAWQAHLLLPLRVPCSLVCAALYTHLLTM